MAGSKRRRKKDLISQADPLDQMAMLSQRALVRAKELARDEPVRTAVPVGTLDDGTLAYVDPAGMVQLEGSDWVLDWWIGAEDRWHFPSSDAAVTQTLVGSTPVVNTAIHVPGGEIIHRVFGARASIKTGAKPWSGGLTVIELENQCAIPVALALVIRPITLWGEGHIGALGSRGAAVEIDGTTAAILSRPILRRVVGPPGTVAIRLDLEDDENPDGFWSVDGQLAEGAFIVPLPYTTVVRVMLPSPTAGEVIVPVADDEPTSGSGGDTKPVRSRWDTGVVWDAPTAAQIEAGWTQVTQGMFSISTPDPLFDELADASGRFATLLSSDSFFESVEGHTAAFRAAILTEGLVTSGAIEGLEPIARALAGAETLRGGIRMDDRSDASVALLHAAAPLLVGSRSEYWSDILVGPVAKAVHRIHRGRGLGKRETGGNQLVEDELRFSAAVAASRLSPALIHVGQLDVAEAAHELYHSLAGGAPGAHDHAGHVAFDGNFGSDGAAGILDKDGDAAISSFATGSAVSRVLRIRKLIRAGSVDAYEQTVALAGRGHLGLLPGRFDDNGIPQGEHFIDGPATLLRLSALMSMFVEDTPSSIRLLSGWSELWFEKPVEVSNVRTRLGTVSFAIRWSGNRPILLWEIEPGVGVDADAVDPIVTAPRLDQRWHAHGWRGEAMLGAVEVSEAARGAIAERDTPRKAVKLGMKKPAAD